MKTTPLVIVAAILSLVLTPHSTLSQETSKAARLAGDAQTALTELYATTPFAKSLAKKANAILVFPKIKKAGFVVGGQHGEGALLKNNTAVAYYDTSGASLGLQAGGQQFGYALFFMNEKALKQLDAADGWEVGVGPSICVVDQGMAKSMTTTTLQDDIYAFVFGQKGLMAGVGLQGNKITRITPK